jgi:hypothetical protein
MNTKLTTISGFLMSIVIIGVTIAILQRSPAHKEWIIENIGWTTGRFIVSAAVDSEGILHMAVGGYSVGYLARTNGDWTVNRVFSSTAASEFILLMSVMKVSTSPGFMEVQMCCLPSARRAS